MTNVSEPQTTTPDAPSSPELLAWIHLSESIQFTHEVDYSHLTDGKLLREIFLQIDGRMDDKLWTFQSMETVKDRLMNWHHLTRNIRNYYMEVLQEVIVMRPANIVLLSRSPSSISAHQEIDKLLLILLCIAVRCERRDHFIRQIMENLDATTQAELMNRIKNFTENSGCVMSLDVLEPTPSYVLCPIRDAMDQMEQLYIQEIRDLLDELEILQAKFSSLQSRMRFTCRGRAISAGRVGLSDRSMSSISLSNPNRTDLDSSMLRLDQIDADRPTDTAHDKLTGFDVTLESNRDSRPTGSINQVFVDSGLTVDIESPSLGIPYTSSLEPIFPDSNITSFSMELAESRAKLRRARAEIEDQADQLNELHDQLSDARRELAQVKEERARLADAAYSARHWQDEVDALREVGDRVQKLEVENRQLKERVNDVDYYKMRCEQMTEDLKILSQEQSEITQNSVNGDVNSTKCAKLEQELSKTRQRLAEVENTRNIDLDEIHTLRQELGQLHLEQCRRGQKRHLTVSIDSELINETRASFDPSDDDIPENLAGRTSESEKCAPVLSTQIAESVSFKLDKLEQENLRLKRQLHLLQKRGREGDCIPNQEEYADFASDVHHDGHISSNLVSNQMMLSYCNQLQKLCMQMKTSLNPFVQSLGQHLTEHNELGSRFTEFKQKLKWKSNFPSLDYSNCVCVSDGAEDATDEDQEEIDSGNKTGDSTEENSPDQHGINRARRKFVVASNARHKKRRAKPTIDFDSFLLETEMNRLETLNIASKTCTQELVMNFQLIEAELANLIQSVTSSVPLSASTADSRAIEQLMDEISRLKTSLTLSEKELQRVNKDLSDLVANLPDTESGKALVNRISDLELQLSRSTRAQLSNRKQNEERIHESERKNADLISQLNSERQSAIKLREQLVAEKIHFQMQTQISQRLEHCMQQLGFPQDQVQKLLSNDLSDDSVKLFEHMIQEAAAKHLEEKYAVLERMEKRLNKYHEHWLLSADLLNYCPDIYLNGLKPSETEYQTQHDQLIVQFEQRIKEIERRNVELEQLLQVEMRAAEEALSQKSQLEQNISAIQKQLEAFQKQQGDLIAAHAELQVENTALSNQHTSLGEQYKQVSTHNAELEAEVNRLRSMLDSSQIVEGRLSTDYQHLQRLHDQLTQEYDSLGNLYKESKDTQRKLKIDLYNALTQLDHFQSASKQVKHLKEALELERGSLRGESKQTVILRETCAHLQSQLDAATESRDQERIQKVAAIERTRDARQRLIELKDRYESLRLEMEEKHKCEAKLHEQLISLQSMVGIFSKSNAKLEKENQSLLLQMQNIIGQNQELLSSTLETCNHRMNEEGALRERLLSLQRQKQHLEDRLVEQYRNQIPVKKNRHGMNLVQKARAALNKRKDPTIENPKKTNSTSKHTAPLEAHQRSNSLWSHYSGSLNSADSSISLCSMNGEKTPIESMQRPIPGSVSIFDRDPDEEDTSDFQAFLKCLETTHPLSNSKKSGASTNRQAMKSSSTLDCLSQPQHTFSSISRQSSTLPAAVVVRGSKHPSGSHVVGKDNPIYRLKLSRSASSQPNDFRHHTTLHQLKKEGSTNSQLSISTRTTENRKSACRLDHLPAIDRCEKQLCEVVTTKSTHDDQYTFSHSRQGSDVSNGSGKKLSASPRPHSATSDPHSKNLTSDGRAFFGSRSLEESLRTDPNGSIQHLSAQRQQSSMTSNAPVGKMKPSCTEPIKFIPNNCPAEKTAREVISRPKVLLEYGDL